MHIMALTHTDNNGVLIDTVGTDVALKLKRMDWDAIVCQSNILESIIVTLLTYVFIYVNYK
jgi:hypothetical protein